MVQGLVFGVYDFRLDPPRRPEEEPEGVPPSPFTPHPPPPSYSGRISLRHYAIGVAPTGLKKSLKGLLQHKDVPDLGHMQDVADFVTRSGFGSVREGGGRGSVGGMEGEGKTACVRKP